MNSEARADRYEALFAKTKAGIKPGLELTHQLLAELGDPHHNFLVVHVAGTNGKGTVCAITEAILRSMGLRTGLFTSPHLVRINERVRIEGEEISDDLLEECLNEIESVEAELERPATFFETLTAAAFLAFSKSGVQVAVIETGLGGRWDSTNVVTPLVSAITPIAIDHSHILGDTISKIASEKAGIIKSERPVVIGQQTAEAFEVLQAKAQQEHSSLIPAAERVSISRSSVSLTGQSIQIETQDSDYGRHSFPLLGDFQLDALTTSLAIVQQVEHVLPLDLSRDHLAAAFAELQWDARCQLLSQDPPLLLDVAHNPAGAKALAATLKQLFGNQKGILIYGGMADKDLDGVLNHLLPRVSQTFTVTIDTPRAESGETLANKIQRLRGSAEPLELSVAIEKATAAAKEDQSFVIIAGSVYLAGEVLGTQVDQGEGALKITD